MRNPISYMFQFTISELAEDIRKNPIARERYYTWAYENPCAHLTRARQWSFETYQLAAAVREATRVD